MAAPAAPRPWSLVRRLTGGVALIAALAFVSQALVLHLWLRPLQGELVAGRAAHAHSLQQALQAVPAADRPALARRLSGERLLILQTPPADDGEPPPFGFTYTLPVDGQSWWFVFSGEPPRAAVIDTVLFWFAAVMAATLAALLLSVRFIARPIGRLAEQIGRQRGPLQPIVEDRHASDELRALVRAFNGLVQAVEAGQATRQQLLAGVSHDLRTPLARLRLRAETQCEGAVADALLADLGLLERIVDQFLAYVQGDQGRPAGRQAPLTTTAAAVVQRYADDGRPVQARLAPLAQVMPDLALQRLLGNLVDNALAYGQPPVRVELAAAGEGAVLRVLDGGFGMSQAEFELAQQPFVRLSAARSDLGHCGLGLAIVAQIARQAGGELRLARVPGAFGIEVTLPASTPAPA